MSSSSITRSGGLSRAVSRVFFPRAHDPFVPVPCDAKHMVCEIADLVRQARSPIPARTSCLFVTSENSRAALSCE
jgi:hypothetical protein